MNYTAIALTVAAAIVLIVLLIAKNRKDRRDYERFLNDEPPRDEDEPNEL